VGVNTLDKGNGTGVPAAAPAAPASPGSVSATPAALGETDSDWMVPAIMTASGAVVLGAGALVWMFWWRRRKPATTDTLINS
jgi:hypothetical protein